MDGPLVSRHLDIFGCKLGLAMHWEFTRQIVPLSGGVVVRYVSNVQAMQGKVPTEFLKLLPGPQTLRQGSWDVANQFRFSARTTNDKTMGLYLREISFLVRLGCSHDHGPVVAQRGNWSRACSWCRLVKVARLRLSTWAVGPCDFLREGVGNCRLCDT
jgi:hypothetical protein